MAKLRPVKDSKGVVITKDNLKTAAETMVAMTLINLSEKGCLELIGMVTEEGGDARITLTNIGDNSVAIKCDGRGRSKENCIFYKKEATLSVSYI